MYLTRFVVRSRTLAQRRTTATRIEILIGNYLKQTSFQNPRVFAFTQIESEMMSSVKKATKTIASLRVSTTDQDVEKNEHVSKTAFICTRERFFDKMLGNPENQTGSFWAKFAVFR